MTPMLPNPADFRVTMMLCDHVAVAEGKFYINGGGWHDIGPGPSPFGLAVLIGVPWTMANKKIKFELRLVKADAEPVMQPGPAGEQPIVVAGEFEVGRPPGSVEGAHIDFPLPLNFPPIGLPPGERLTWELLLNDDPGGWTVPFNTRPNPSVVT